MSRPMEDLGFLEQQVLFSCIRLHPNGYGVSIGDEIARQTGKEYSPGSIYAAIERLENKGYLRRRKGEPRAVRGGRAKDYFTVSGEGQRALQDVTRAVAAMSAGLEIRGFVGC